MFAAMAQRLFTTHSCRKLDTQMLMLFGKRAHLVGGVLIKAVDVLDQRVDEVKQHVRLLHCGHLHFQ